MVKLCAARHVREELFLLTFCPILYVLRFQRLKSPKQIAAWAISMLLEVWQLILSVGALGPSSPFNY